VGASALRDSDMRSDMHRCLAQTSCFALPPDHILRMGRKKNPAIKATGATSSKGMCAACRASVAAPP
jgi:hypothetical protein